MKGRWALLWATLLVGAMVYGQTAPVVITRSGQGGAGTFSSLNVGAGGVTTDGGLTAGPRIDLAGPLTSCALRVDIDSNFMYIFCALRPQGNIYLESGKIYGGIGSGNTLFELSNGQRLDFGSGSLDYATGDGTNVIFAGPVQTGALTVNGTNDVRINTGAAYYMNGTTGTAFIYYDGSQVNIGTASTKVVVAGNIESTLRITSQTDVYANGSVVAGATGSAASYFLGTKALFSTTVPTLSGFTGTGAAVSSNNGTSAFDINVGTVAPGNTGTIVLPTAAVGWICRCYNKTTTTSLNEIVVTGDTTGGCSIAQVVATTNVAANWTASDHLRCTANPL